jgi:hypothetical protein
VAKVTERPGAGGFSALEQKFFEGAPPEVAVAPPPAVTFDDLDPVRPERRKVRRTAPRRVAAAPVGKERVSLARTRLRALTALARAAVRAGLARVRPFIARAGALGAAKAQQGGRDLMVAARRARASARPALQAALSRFFDGLPGERPDGRTLLATIAVVVVVCSLSATVLGSRGTAWRAPAAVVAPTR